MDHQTAARRGFQDHEMVHVPVQDRRHAQLAEMRQLNAQRAACQLQMAGGLDERSEGHALQRHGVTPPQCVEIDAVPEIGGDHREAGDAALSGLGLQHYRKTGASPKIQIFLLHSHILL
jgi:hypothetical protein